MSEAAAIFLLLSVVGLAIFALLSRNIRELRDSLETAQKRIEYVDDERRKDYWRAYHRLQALYDHLGVVLNEQPAQMVVRKRD